MEVATSREVFRVGPWTAQRNRSDERRFRERDLNDTFGRAWPCEHKEVRTARPIKERAYRPRRTVILEFPSMANLKRWWDSPEYQELCDIRKRSADSNIVTVDGA